VLQACVRQAIRGPPSTCWGLPSNEKPELFSEIMHLVSGQPEYRKKVLTGLRETRKFGEFLSPDLVENLRMLILGQE
jgi:hypothetical protein